MMSSLYLKERALEEEYPGIGFRNGASGREAYVLGHRVAVWEVVDVVRQVKSVARTAGHFRWPPSLVKFAMAFAEAYPGDIEEQRSADRSSCARWSSRVTCSGRVRMGWPDERNSINGRIANHREEC